MTQTRELERSPVENGSGSLNDRVRSLRLTQQSATKSRTAVLPWALCVILLLTSAAFGYRAYRVGSLNAAGDSSTTSDRNPAPPASTAPTTSVASSGEVVLQAKGYVIPAHQVQVSPKVGGMILKLNEKFEEGQFFNKGEVLAWLETDDYEADWKHAVAARDAAYQRKEEAKCNRPEEIKAALNELKESEETLKQLDLDLRRSERLVGTTALSAKEYEQSKFPRDAMKRRVDRLRFQYDLMKKGPREEKQKAAEADWKAAEADVARTKWRLDNCEIKAPISGHILTKKAEKGNVVNPLAFTISSSLCEMADLGDLEIDLSVQERDIARVEEGQLCTAIPEAYQNHEPFRKRHPRGYEGKVIRLMPIADLSKGAINVRVKVQIPPDEVGKVLKPQMSVLVSFLQASK
ncbi:MAG TPA: efflux RND transporter periplasmic adaptor subunit [Gemmataceae bacterium]|jgi:HlyD family secretion protein